MSYAQSPAFYQDNDYMDIASAYIPMDRRQAIAYGDVLPQRTQGATLFADISGFTPLTEALARELGPKRGAEELTVHLNRVYDALITELHKLGGSVISFSGDAITCWFDGDDGRCATACGLAMQAAMAQFAEVRTHSGHVVSLGMKAAVAVGAVRRFVVGLPEYTLIDAMAGKTLENVAAAEHQAERGDVILDEAAAAALADVLQIAEWREEHGQRFAVVTGLTVDVPLAPWPPLADGDLDEAQREAWLLPAVYQRLQGERGEFLAELRSAAAVFMRFGGIDYDQDEQSPQKLDALIQQVQRILIRYDGSLLQLTIGDKGSYMYAAFGAPIAHEDNVDRALATALELQALPGQFDFLPPLQIGVTYGRMRVGAYGGVARRTYGVLGDAVNLSARLMSAAQPGQILVSDEAFARASEAMFVWEALPAIMVKGKQEPVSLKRLVRARRRRAGFSLADKFPERPLGREALLANLDEVMTALRSGVGRSLHLVGEAGMGKSHLGSYLTQQAQTDDVQVALGRCQSITHNVPYAPWRQIFLDLLDLQDDTDEIFIAQLVHLFEVAQPQWMLRLPLLGDLLALPLPDNATTAALDSDMRQKALFSLLVEMLQTWAGKRPLLLIIENAHWMDEASLALAQTVAQQVVSSAPVLLLLPYRPPELGADSPLRGLRDLPHTTLYQLAEMPDADVAALLQRKLSGTPSSLLLDVVQRVAHGNPFFVSELLDAMRAGNQLAQDDDEAWVIVGDLLETLRRANFVVRSEGKWQLRQDVDLSAVKLGLPDSIHGLILSRLDRLPEEHKLTLKVSSVIGYTFDLALLTEVHPEEKEIPEVEAEARYMDAEQVLREEEPQRKYYAFRHHTAQEVAYETLLFTQRQLLHRAVATALAVKQPEATAEIAHHAFLGELWPLSLQYNLLAGMQAKQLHAVQQSIDFLQKALHSTQMLPQEETAVPRKQIHLVLGELLISIGHYDAAAGHLQAALALAQAQGDAVAEAQGCRWYGRSHELRGEYTLALTWLDKGLAALNGQTDAEEAEMLLIAGLINLRQGNYQQALQLCERSLQVGQLLNDAAIRARTYNLMGIGELRGNTVSAIERFTQSLALYQQLDNVYGQATSHNLLANGYFSRSEWSQADYHYRQSLNMFIQIGNTYNQVLVNNNLGGIALRQGRLDAALGYYERAARLMGQIGGSLFVQGALHLNMGHTHLKRQDLAAATASLQLARSYIEQAQVRELLPELWGLFAEAAWLQGDLVEAETQGQRAVALARELGMPQEEGHNLRIMGEIARTRQQLAEAEDYFQESYRILAEAGDEYERARTQLSLADFYAAQGARAQALAALAICEPIFAHLEATPDYEKARALQSTLL
ncbi:MAG: tetratricopeptide repeat protein [Ardenticatenaceae bacterium]|nr:tetratricopeptide repeat protein [Ardenticatenaceae bacterium]